MTTSEAEELIGKQCEVPDMEGVLSNDKLLTIIGILEPVDHKTYVLCKGFKNGHNGRSGYKCIAGTDNDESSTSLYVNFDRLRIVSSKGYKKSKKEKTLFNFDDL